MVKWVPYDVHAQCYKWSQLLHIMQSYCSKNMGWESWGKRTWLVPSCSFPHTDLGVEHQSPALASIFFTAEPPGKYLLPQQK